MAHTLSPRYIPLVVLSSVFKSVAPFINIIFPKYIIDELLGKQRWAYLLGIVLLVVGGNFLFSLVNRIFDRFVETNNIILMDGLDLHFGQHIMNMDFESLEDPRVLNQKEEAVFYINNQNAIRRLIDCLIGLLKNIITFIGLIVVILTLSGYLILIIVFINLVSVLLLKNVQDFYYRFNEENVPLNRKLSYYTSLESDITFAKEVRLYNLAPLILHKYKSFNEQFFQGMGKLFGLQGRFQGLANILQSAQMAAIYAFMIRCVYIGSISIGDFTMYIIAANNFSSLLSTIAGSLVELFQISRFLESYAKFNQIPKKMRMGNKALASIKNMCIEFHDVSFRYPNAEEYALKNVSIKIMNNEKLSIVGQNGSGKTTFIKLLCRLYDPDEGEILVNGVNIKDYDFDRYMDILSVVFQDYKLYAFTIKENVVFNNAKHVADDDVLAALEKVGLDKRIGELPHGIKTYLYKIFDENGIEFSGGQSQKLAITRAIYKNAPLLILDEPTASLDPYSEAEIFTTINKLALNKTTIYISHRLSSCRFCDYIAVFDKGEIVEYGNHESLLKTDGKYKEMWDA